jgi:hypothetical protein
LRNHIEDFCDTGNCRDPEEFERIVTVLLDREAFSEETLKKLFALLSKRFPEPKRMMVEVYTNLKQIPTPEEGRVPAVSEVRLRDLCDGCYWADLLRARDEYRWAILIRSDGDGLIIYNPNPPSLETKEIVLKRKE